MLSKKYLYKKRIYELRGIKQKYFRLRVVYAMELLTNSISVNLIFVLTEISNIDVRMFQDVLLKKKC